MGERVATNRFTTSTLSPELYTLFVVALTDVIVAQQGTVVHGDSAVKRRLPSFRRSCDRAAITPDASGVLCGLGRFSDTRLGPSGASTSSCF